MLIRRNIRLALMLVGISVALTDTAVFYYTNLARRHGRQLQRGLWGGYYIG